MPSLTEESTPDHLVPRMGDLPISNARYVRTAAVTRIPRSDPPQRETTWFGHGPVTPEGGPVIGALAIAPGGTWVATGDEAGAVRTWTSEGAPVLVPAERHDGPVRSVDVDPSGARLVSADAEGTVRLWDTGTGAPLGPPLRHRTSGAVGVAFAGPDRLVVAGRRGTLALLTLDAQHTVTAEDTLARPAAGPFTILRAAVRSGGPVVVAGGADGSVGFGTDGSSKTWRTASGRHPGAVTAAAIAPDARLVATAGQDGSVRLWDPRSGEPAGSGAWRHDARVTSLAWSADGSLLVSCGLDGIRMWDPVSGAPVGPVRSGGGVGFVAAAVGPTVLVVADTRGRLWTWTDGVRALAGPFVVPPPRSAAAPARAAEGVLLVHEQSWVMQGLALGELLHSVSLAPGEITQIAVTSHTRSVLQDSADVASQDELLARSGTSAGSLAESERTSATQTTADTTVGVAQGATSEIGAGGLLSGLGFSGGSALTTSTAVTATFATGVRELSDESNQDVHQQAVDVAHLARRRHTASVREVSESDALELRTRVVANYNHMHALTLQYYEVVQVARLRTRVVDAHRLLFVPMKMVDFADPEQTGRALARYRREIVDTAHALGLHDVATGVDLLLLGAPLGLPLRAVRVAQVWRRAAEAAAALATAHTRAAEAGERAQEAGDAVLAARDALRAADDPGLAARAALQRSLSTATDEGRVADAAALAAAADVARLAREHDEARRDRAALAALLAADPGATEPPALDETLLDALTARVHRALAHHRTAVNQGIWMRLDPGVYAGMLEGATHDGVAVAPTLDPTPVAVAGSYVGLRWPHADPDAARRFRERHVDRAPELDEAMPLPTGGVFGEAVLGEAVAAEKLDLTRFWNWADALPPIRPTGIDPIGQTDDDPLPVPTRAEVPAATINLGPVTFPQLASGVPALAAAAANPELFADLTGAATSAALARSAIELSASGASTAATLAGENFRRHLQFQRQVAGAVMDAVGDGKGRLDPTLAGAALNAGGGPPAREKAGAAGSPWSAPAAGEDGAGDGTGGTAGDAGDTGDAAGDGSGGSTPGVEFVTDQPEGTDAP
ncbi:WD40 repeat domain-containing protein [Pseudonocardia sp.]|uniref:WD40 repeat domain-containing protein n=1 Tax=Pseudonocardia sp. TaxID=60912 RepID=UPI003D0C413C